MPYIIFKVTAGNKTRVERERGKEKPLSSGQPGREVIRVCRWASSPVQQVDPQPQILRGAGRSEGTAAMAGFGYPQEAWVRITLKPGSKSKVLGTYQGLHEATQHEAQEWRTNSTLSWVACRNSTVKATTMYLDSASLQEQLNTQIHCSMFCFMIGNFSVKKLDKMELTDAAKS